MPCIASNDGESVEYTVLDFRETGRAQTRPERGQHTGDIKAPYSGHRDGTELEPRGDPGTVMLSIQGCRQETTKDTWQETEADGKKITGVQCLGNQRKKMLQE